MNKLKGKIREKGKTYKDCAEYLGIATCSFSDKINETAGKEFKKSEMMAIKEYLEISDEEAQAIFFDE